MPQLLNLLSPSYLFRPNLGPFVSPLAWVFLFALVLGMLLTLWLKVKFVKNKDIFAKKAARRLFSLVWTMGWIGIFLWLFRQINALYISAPVFLLIWAIISLIWLVIILKYWFITVPNRRRQLNQETGKKLYMP